MMDLFTQLAPAAVPRGDFYFTAWVITIAYFVAAGMCAWAAKKEKEQNIGRARKWMAPVFWYTMLGLLIVLGINKQFDFQSDLTGIGRRLARSEGWYEYRRVVQAIFIVIFALGAVAAVAGAAWYMRDLFNRYRTAFIGIIYLCAFVIMRAASFHHMDVLLYGPKGDGFIVNTFLELGGICLIGYAAWKAATMKPPQPKYQSFEKKVSIR